MNNVALIGNLTAEPQIRYSQNQMCVAAFTLAVARRKKDDGADFISCKAFGKTAETIEKYVKKGQKIAVVGRIQTGSYEKDGKKVYTTDVIADSIEFVTSKNEEQKPQPKTDDKGFMNLENIDVDELPFV